MSKNEDLSWLMWSPLVFPKQLEIWLAENIWKEKGIFLFVCSTFSVYGDCEMIISLNWFPYKGVESLETAINYWEDALAAYQSVSSGSGAVLLTAEEAEFCRSLERVLKVIFLFVCF